MMCKDHYNNLLSLYTHDFVILLIERESIATILKCGLALWLALNNRMQKMWHRGTSKPRSQDSSVNMVMPCEEAWLSCLRMKDHGESHPAKWQGGEWSHLALSSPTQASTWLRHMSDSKWHKEKNCPAKLIPNCWWRANKTVVVLNH